MLCLCGCLSGCVPVCHSVCLSVVLVCLCVCTCVCVCVCVHVWVWVYTCVCVYLCTASGEFLSWLEKIRCETGPPSEGLLPILSMDRVLIKENTKSGFKYVFHSNCHLPRHEGELLLHHKNRLSTEKVNKETYCLLIAPWEAYCLVFFFNLKMFIYFYTKTQCIYNVIHQW